MLNFNDKKGFICDMDGVIYHGNKILPGVPEFIDWLQRTGKEYLFLTNNSGCTPLERAILNARLVQKPEHAVKQSTFLRARAAVDDQHARKSAFFQQLRQLLCAACAEHDLSRYEIFKSVHMLILRRSLP